MRVKVSIHAPRVGCDTLTGYYDFGTYVSIHAPRVGCDDLIKQLICLFWSFQFTHPVWGATAMPKDTHK